MKIRQFSIAVLFLMMAAFARGAEVSGEDAQKAALNFFNRQSVAFPEIIKGDAFVLAAISVTKENVRIFDIINMTSGGWVIIAADDRVMPVLAYAPSGTLEPDKGSPELKWWLGNYAEQIAAIIAADFTESADIEAQWMDVLNDEAPMLKSGAKTISPLLTSTWDQGKYYNYYCPLDGAGPGGRVWAGCVATSISQVMYYYRYPQQGTGSHGYYSDYGWLEADFGNTTYDWNAMQNDINHNYNLPMAIFQLHCGIAVDMMYSPDGSGAYMDDAANALVDYFGYSPATNLKYKNSYNDTQWETMLKAELDAKHPISYAGYGDGGGHAFVCDGYDGTGKFHFNFGWSGYGDGYYYLDNLSPSYNFTDGQQAIFGAVPSSGYPYGCAGNTTLIAMQGSIEDGSGPVADYTPNADCYWLIDPVDQVEYIQLFFSKFSTESTNDVLTIYDGGTTAAPILGTFSGNNLPASLMSSGDKLLLHFTSNSAVNAGGWLLDYKTVLPDYCPYLTELNTATGTFTDGSAAEPYHNSTSCRWRIAPPGATGITITFDEFDLDGNDFLAIFDEVSNIEIETFSGSTLPPYVFVYSSKAFVVFMSDALGTAAGFDANYSSSTSGLETVGASTTLLVYPNPAGDALFFSAPAEGLVEVALMNHLGQEVMKVSGLAENGVFKYQLNVASFAQGLYYLSFESAGQRQLHPVAISH